jgi:hypothetical protein
MRGKVRNKTSNRVKKVHRIDEQNDQHPNITNGQQDT